MSASRPILVVARVVEALPRLAADHVPHALAQRLARGLDLGGQFAYYQYESERPAEHPSCAYLRAYPYKYSYERQPRSIPQRMARALARGLDLGGQFAYYERKTVLTKKTLHGKYTSRCD